MSQLHDEGLTQRKYTTMGETDNESMILGQISQKEALKTNDTGRPCAGINRHEVENERVLQERNSEPS